MPPPRRPCAVFFGPCSISTTSASPPGASAGVAHRTPVLTSRTLDAMLGAQVFLKAENLQRMGAFKFRGGYNAVNVLSEAQRERGVVAFSSGNHAQAVALAAQLHGCRATIVMPHDAPANKLAATRGYGADVVTYDRLQGRSRGDRDAPGRGARRELDPALRSPAGDGRPGHGGARTDRGRRAARRARRVRRRRGISLRLCRRGPPSRAGHPRLRRRARARQRHAAVAAARRDCQHRGAAHDLRRPADAGRRQASVRGDPCAG